METWEDKFQKAIDLKDRWAIGDLVDLGFRHKVGATIQDCMSHWIRVARHFGYATHDGSWAEFEKEFTIIIIKLVCGDNEEE